MEQLELSYVAGRNVKWLEISLAVSYKLKFHLPFNPAIPFLVTYPEESKAYFQEKPCIKMVIAA